VVAAGMVICLDKGADLHMVQLCHCHSLFLVPENPGFTFLVPAHPGSPGQNPEKL